MKILALPVHGYSSPNKRTRKYCQFWILRNSKRTLWLNLVVGNKIRTMQWKRVEEGRKVFGMELNSASCIKLFDREFGLDYVQAQ